MSASLIESMMAAVEASPADLPLRRHLAELLVAAGRGPEAVGHLAVALQADPADAPTQALMARALGAAAPPPVAEPEQDEPRAVDWGAYEDEFAGHVPPRVRVNTRSIEFQYRRYEVEINFRHNGTADVGYDD